MPVLAAGAAHAWRCECTTPNTAEDIECAACGQPAPFAPKKEAPKVMFGFSAPAPQDQNTNPQPTNSLTPTSQLTTSQGSTLESQKNDTHKANEAQVASLTFGHKSETHTFGFPKNDTANAGTTQDGSKIQFGAASSTASQITTPAFGFVTSSTPSKPPTTPFTIPAKPSARLTLGPDSPDNDMEWLSKSTPAVCKENTPVLLGGEDESVTNIALTKVTADTLGTVYTWGSGECDQQAVRTENLDEHNCRPTPIVIKRLSTPSVKEIACGSLHSLALMNNKVYSWGCCDGGTLGRPLKGVRIGEVFREDGQEFVDPWKHYDLSQYQILGSKVPAPIFGIPESVQVTKLGAGSCHSAFITRSGDCYCWGSYRDFSGPIGFLGDAPGTLKDIQVVPRRMPIEGVAIDLACGENHTVVLCVDRGKRFLTVWGSSEFGQLGLPPTDYENRSKYLEPHKLSLEDLRFQKPKTAAGETIADFVDVDNQNVFKQGSLLHVFAGSCSTFLSVSCEGRIHIFALGRSASGELGIDALAPIVQHPVEVKVPACTQFKTIAAGDYVALALSEDGSAWSWGQRSFAGLGACKEADLFVKEPTLIPGLRNKVFSVTVGTGTSYVTTTNGSMYAWGDGLSHTLGTGEEPDDPVDRPQLVASSSFEGRLVTKVAAGSQHAIALTIDRKAVESRSADLRSSDKRTQESSLGDKQKDEEMATRGIKRKVESGDERQTKKAKAHETSNSSTPKLARKDSDESIRISDPVPRPATPENDLESPIKGDTKQLNRDESMRDEQPAAAAPEAESEEEEEQAEPPKRQVRATRAKAKAKPKAKAAPKRTKKTVTPESDDEQEEDQEDMPVPKARGKAKAKAKPKAKSRAKAAAKKDEESADESDGQEAAAEVKKPRGRSRAAVTSQTETQEEKKRPTRTRRKASQ